MTLKGLTYFNDVFHRVMSKNVTIKKVVVYLREMVSHTKGKNWILFQAGVLRNLFGI